MTCALCYFLTPSSAYPGPKLSENSDKASEGKASHHFLCDFASLREIV